MTEKNLDDLTDEDVCKLYLRAIVTSSDLLISIGVQLEKREMKLRTIEVSGEFMKKSGLQFLTKNVTIKGDVEQ